jgi:hypothetical protein
MKWQTAQQSTTCRWSVSLRRRGANARGRARQAGVETWNPERPTLVGFLVGAAADAVELRQPRLNVQIE